MVAVNVGETIGVGGQAHLAAAARRDLAAAALNDVDAHLNLAVASQHLGEKDLALRHYEEALRRSGGDNIVLLLHVVEALGALGQRAAAVTRAQDAMKLLESLSTAAALSTVGGSRSRSSGLASFYYSLASTLGSLGASADHLQPVFEKALALTELPTRAPDGAGDGPAEPMGSAMRCRIAYQLAMIAGASVSHSRHF